MSTHRKATSARVIPLSREPSQTPAPDTLIEALRSENHELRHRLEEAEKELAEIDQERQMLVIELGAVNQELDRLVRTLEKQAITDPLTGLYNKRHLWEQLGREVARAARTARPLAAMFIDIDHFKRCNDDHGHATGDEVLRQVAELVARAVRRCDLVCGVDLGSTLARFGGEEFVLVLPETDAAGAAAVAERIRRTVAEATFLGPGGTPKLQVTVSLGVSEYTKVDGGNFRGLLDRADRALYDAKRGGRNRVASCLPEA
ncbi:MAG: hypothetical protein AMXMBFR64_17290 [Myxococcales bacterium]